jgi:hypothetical protein
MRCPLKDNDILFRDNPGRELKQNLEFPLFIALNEVGIVECQPLVPTLKIMADFVNQIVFDLASLLR